MGNTEGQVKPLSVHWDCYDRFLELPAATANVIYTAALDELAAVGMWNIRMEHLAVMAGMSVQDFLELFPAASDVLYAVSRRSIALLVEAIEPLMTAPVSVSIKLEKLLRKLCTLPPAVIELIKSYNVLCLSVDCSTATTLSLVVERPMVEVYLTILQQSRESGELREDVDIHASAYLIDCLVKDITMAFLSSYHMMGLKQFMGEPDHAFNDIMIDKTLSFIEPALRLRIP